MATGVSFKAVKQPTRNEAVQFCLDIWRDEYNKQRAAKESEYAASQKAHNAFREAMPDLIGETDIRDFIACVGRGILIGAIDTDDASKLLAAARIASQSIAAERKAAALEEAADQKAAKMAEEAVFKALENAAATAAALS